MNAPAVNSNFRSKAVRVVSLLRTKGFWGISKAISKRLRLQLRLIALGRSRTVTLDGCRFPLRDLPNTPMKLELLRGSYEGPERSAARRYVNPEWPVVELGGCIGVVACVTNKFLSQPERHVVVEANPFVISQLEANRDRNQCSFSIVNRALAYDSTHVRLMPSPDFWGTSLYERGDLRPYVDVPATQLQSLVQDMKFENFALICDIEGQEYGLVKNELETLKRARVIIMELHPNIIGADKVSELLAELGKIGFTTTELTASVVVLQKN